MSGKTLRLSQELSQVPDATPLTTQPLATGTDLMSGGALPDVFGALLLVLLLIVALAWLARRLQQPTAGHGQALRIRGGLSLGPRERLMLVQAADTWMLLAVMPGNVRTVHVFPFTPGLPEVEDDGAPASGAAALVDRFSSWLRNRHAA